MLSVVEIPSVVERRRRTTVYIGDTVMAEFEMKNGVFELFEGRVSGFNDKTGYYTVQYEDGDEEELLLLDVLSILVEPRGQNHREEDKDDDKYRYFSSVIINTSISSVIINTSISSVIINTSISSVIINTSISIYVTLSLCQSGTLI